jgi:aromatic-L-amino-acid decarboxylase
MKEDLSAEHERLGRAVVEIIKAHAASLEARPVTSEATPADLEKLFDEPLPREGMSADAILDQFNEMVSPHAMQIPSPRYYGLFNPTPLPLAVWADALASSLNQNGAVWRNSPSANVCEARVLRWLCELIGYDAAADSRSFGTLTSGGSEANLLGLKCARDRAALRARDEGLRAAGADLVAYASEQCHYSLVKSVDILGMGRESLRKIPTDDNFQIRLDLLRAEIERDLREGRTPCCIAGAAGATSTGVVDPLDQLAELAREYDCWFHVDAAYGGALAFSDQHRTRLKGIERADSITIDPHKWMFVPFECGALVVREGAQVLRAAFDITPEYLSEKREHLSGRDVEFDFFRYGQLGTRRFNALKIWMALKHLGTRGYAAIIERQIELTHYLAGRLGELDGFRRIGPIHTAVCCFRFLPAWAAAWDGPAQDQLQMSLQQRIERSGAAWFSTTVLHERRALRFNINSFLTEERHLDDLVEVLRREADQLSAELS